MKTYKEEISKRATEATTPIGMMRFKQNGPQKEAISYYTQGFNAADAPGFTEWTHGINCNWVFTISLGVWISTDVHNKETLTTEQLHIVYLEGKEKSGK